MVSSTAVVGVRPELQVKGVSMLLRNDLAGGKVLPEPIITRELRTEADNVENIVICADTRTITRKAKLGIARG